jgi:Tfp pilus assembly protein FimT
MFRNLKKGNQGITVIEILIGLGVLVLLVSFAAPSITGANTSMQMRAAAENVEYSIDIARNTARMAEAPVTMNVLTDATDGSQRITFTLSDRAQKKLSQPNIPEFQLDETLAFETSQTSFEFDGRGLVNNPGTLTLYVKDEQNSRTSFVVE